MSDSSANLCSFLSSTFFFSYMWSSQSDKSDDVFPLFFASCPPTSFLSSVLSLHTVFPTYMACTMCNTYIVTHAPTRIHTYTNHNAVHITVALVFLASRNAHTNWYIRSWHTPTLQLPESKHQVIAISDNFQSLKHLVFLLSFHSSSTSLSCRISWCNPERKNSFILSCLSAFLQHCLKAWVFGNMSCSHKVWRCVSFLTLQNTQKQR